MPRSQTRPDPARRHPHVTVNMALSADGKIASVDHRLHTFGSPADQRHLQTLRRSTDAILCGARTVALTRATLGPGSPRDRARRIREGRAPEPLRILLSGSGRIDPGLPVWRTGSAPIVVATRPDLPARRLAALRRLTSHVWTSPTPSLQLQPLLEWLAAEQGVRHLLCEGGGVVNEALFREELVDILHLTLCPLLIGGRSAPTLADGPGFPSIDLAGRFSLHRVRRAGNEVFLEYHACRTPHA